MSVKRYRYSNYYAEMREDEDGELISYNDYQLLQRQCDDLKARLAEINNWAVCGCIASPEDMMQNLPRIIELSDISADEKKT